MKDYTEHSTVGPPYVYLVKIISKCGQNSWKQYCSKHNTIQGNILLNVPCKRQFLVIKDLYNFVNANIIQKLMPY